MIASRWLPLILVVFSSNAVTHAETTIAQDRIIDTLSYIRKGYESNQGNGGPAIVEGRIFHSQKAREGYTLPDNQIFEPRWYAFRTLSKGGKRRYEQETLVLDATQSPHTMYVLDNDRRLLNYAPYAVKIFPIDKEDEHWRKMAGLYGKMMRPDLAQGYDTVALMTQTLAKHVETGVFKEEGANISVATDDQGVFHIAVKRGIVEDEYWIDSRKAFNMVRAKHSHPHPKLWYQIEQTLEYTQLEDGRWVLEKATRNDIENGAAIEHKLEVTAIRTDVEIPDDVFELDSLNLPNDVYTIDYSFSPPLELNRGNRPNIDYLGVLMDTRVDSSQIASVDAAGSVEVKDHAAFREYERDHQAGHSAQKGSARVQTPHNIGRVVPWIVGSIVAILAVVGVCSRHYRIQGGRQ